MNRPRALLLYDARCRFCTASVRWAHWLVPGGAVRLADVNDPRLQVRYGITPAAAQAAMHLVRPGDRVSRGATALRDLLRLSSWAFPLAWAWAIPGVAGLADRAYAWVAAHRYLFLGRSAPAACESGACAIHPPRPAP